MSLDPPVVGRADARGAVRRMHGAARRVVGGAGAFALVVASSLLMAAAPAAADDVRDKSWQVAALKLAQVHKVTQGDGVVVAVVDTGVDPNHQDLRGNVLPGFDVTVSGNPGKGWRDTKGHGTAMASLIAGHGHGAGGRDGILGIAPKAKILPLDVTDPDSGVVVPGSVGTAIRLAVDHGADVICVALAGGYEANEEAAIRYARDHDVVVVAGVGNAPAALVEDPASIALALAVTAYHRDGKVATTVKGVPGREIDIAAPGGDILVATPGDRYGIGTGTSNSTAIVAGTLALVLHKHPDASRDEQVERIVFTANDMGDKGKDDVFGWGAVNVVEAVTGTPRRPAGGEEPTASGSSDGPPSDGIAGGGYSSEENRDAELVGLAVVVGVVLVVFLVIAATIVFVRSRRRR